MCIFNATTSIHNTQRHIHTYHCTLPLHSLYGETFPPMITYSLSLIVLVTVDYSTTQTKKILQQLKQTFQPFLSPIGEPSQFLRVHVSVSCFQTGSLQWWTPAESTSVCCLLTPCSRKQSHYPSLTECT